MKFSSFALALGAAFITPLAGGATTDPVMVPIKHFDDGFNTNNMPLAMSAFVKSGIVILDEVPPHEWSGPNAVNTWLKDLGARNSKDAITDESVVFGKPLVESSNGTTGYVVSKVEYLYKEHGKPMHEPATMTFALKKVGGAWLISGWTWNGTVPQPGP
jgi:hypothetical protein